MLSSKNGFSLHSHEKNVILAHNRLENLKDTNKIVIIAGSNGAFGIISKMISDTYKMPVVNTSTHASIGVRLQFEMYKDLLHSGDIVLFIPEYEGTKQRLYGGSVVFRILSTHMPLAYYKLSLAQWLFLYKYIGVNFKELNKYRGQKIDGPYSEKALNAFGDIECERKHRDSITPYYLKGRMDERVIEYYKYIHSYTAERGVELIFLPPTFIKSSYDINKNQIDSMAIALKQNGIGYQSSPSKYTFPDSLYFDTPYHMTQLGAKIRTQQVIEDINRILKNKSIR